MKRAKTFEVEKGLRLYFTARFTIQRFDMKSVEEPDKYTAYLRKAWDMKLEGRFFVGRNAVAKKIS